MTGGRSCNTRVTSLTLDWSLVVGSILMWRVEGFNMERVPIIIIVFSCVFLFLDCSLCVCVCFFLLPLNYQVLLLLLPPPPMR